MSADKIPDKPTQHKSGRRYFVDRHVAVKSTLTVAALSIGLIISARHNFLSTDTKKIGGQSADPVGGQAAGVKLSVNLVLTRSKTCRESNRSVGRQN